MAPSIVRTISTGFHSVEAVRRRNCDPWLEQHTELTNLVEAALATKTPDRVAGPAIGYALRYHKLAERT
jgi:hypothetical protein